MALLIPTRRHLLAPNPIGKRLLHNLFGYWGLQEQSGTRYDLSGFASHLTDANTVTGNPGPSGKLPLASQFTALNTEYLSIADNAACSIGDIAMDLICWGYLDTTPGAGAAMRFVSKWGLAGDIEFNLFVDNTAGTIRFNWAVRNLANDAFTTVTANTFGAPSTATWYMLHAYHDPTANVIGISVNNGVADTAAWTQGVRDGTAPFEIGRDPGGSYLDGRVAGMALWKHTTMLLTAPDLVYLYNAGLGRSFQGSRGFV